MILLAVTAILSSTVTHALADSVDPNIDIKVSAIVQESFQKDYPNAEYVRWYKNGDYYVASFNNELQRLSVYYDDNGNVYSITRFIKCESVPLNAIKSVTEKYGVTEADIAAMEVSKESRTYYLFSFTKDNKYYIIESDASGNLKMVKKQKIALPGTEEQ